MDRDEDIRNTEEALGIVRCVECGHRLDGEEECPFCRAVESFDSPAPSNKWLIVTAGFMTSPLSAYWIIRSPLLSPLEKALALSGAGIWLVTFILY